jgi:hypothetical protein
MSGGSFDYLYDRIDCGNTLETYTLELLGKMAEWLAEPEQGQPDAAAEIARIHAELLAIKQQVEKLAQRRAFLQLLKTAEWWCSKDTGKDGFESEWAKYQQIQDMLANGELGEVGRMDAE